MNFNSLLYLILTFILSILTFLTIILGVVTQNYYYFFISFYSAIFFSASIVRYRSTIDKTYRLKFENQQLATLKRRAKLLRIYQIKYKNEYLKKENFKISKEVNIMNGVFGLYIFCVDDINKKLALSNKDNITIYSYYDIVSFKVSNFDQAETKLKFLGKAPLHKKVNVYYCIITIQFKNNQKPSFVTLKLNTQNNHSNIATAQDIIGTLEYIQNYNNTNP